MFLLPNPGCRKKPPCTESTDPLWDRLVSRDCRDTPTSNIIPPSAFLATPVCLCHISMRTCFFILLLAATCGVRAWLPTGRRPVAARRATSTSTLSKLSMMAPPAEFDWKVFKKSTEEKMSKSLENIQTQMNTLRAGGASPAMLDRVFVDQYGTPTPLGQVARVATSGAQQLVVEPFDKSLVKEIEKAISTSDLNLTPTNDGSGVIRINVPPLTEDRRKELCKQAKIISEDGKVAVRNVRRDSVDKIKVHVTSTHSVTFMVPYETHIVFSRCAGGGEGQGDQQGRQQRVSRRRAKVHRRIHQEARGHVEEEGNRPHEDLRKAL